MDEQNYLVVYSGSFMVTAKSPEEAKQECMKLAASLLTSVHAKVTPCDERGKETGETVIL
jgi:hypothetical protein